MPGENSGEGNNAVPPAPATTPSAAPPAPDPVLARLDALATRLANHEQLFMEMAQGQRQPAPQRGGGEELENEDDLVDPVVKKHLDANRRALDARLNEVNERTDHLAYSTYVSNLGLEPEVVAEVEKTFATWRKNGITFGDKPPSRFDALRYTIGTQGEQNIIKARKDGQLAEDQRRADNVHGHVERAGRAPVRASSEPEPGTLSRKERTKDGGAYWQKRLDSEPW